MDDTKGFGGEDAGEPDDPLDPTGLLTPLVTRVVGAVAVVGGLAAQLSLLSPGAVRPGTPSITYSALLTLLTIASIPLLFKHSLRHVLLPVLVLLASAIYATASWAAVNPAQFGSPLMLLFPLLFTAVLLNRTIFVVQMVLIPILLALSWIDRFTSWPLYFTQVGWNASALFLAGLGIRLVRDRAADSLAEVRRLSNIDPLTGLANRRFVDDRASAVLKDAARRGKSIAVFALDLDHFKEINDEHGHAVGDQVLRSVSSAVRDIVRGSDIAVRTGGEEILVIGAVESAQDVIAIARLLHATVSSVVVAAPRGQIRPTCSLGAALAAPPTADDAGPDWLWRLVEDADAALYRAKAAGRDRWVVADQT